MKIKTKSGFSCEVNEAKTTDWRFATNLAKCDSNDESAILQGMTFVVPFLLGEDGEEALIKHVMDDSGIAKIENVMTEFKEIIIAIGEKQKKS